ncbi:MAG TPA: site-2 protease family protein, partial [Candidatus Eremiobacteraceae bacterium]|nr:site-2 protease family protein [Candidatus Eremiobacteraceae bacterium]
MTIDITIAVLSVAKVLANVEHVLVFLALLSVLILFHEFGHFVMAKRARVTVTDFALGFGPSLVALRRGDTTYRINALPLGGYCKMAGEDTADDGSTDPGNFQHKSIFARFAIIAAGPIFNLILAVLI